MITRINLLPAEYRRKERTPLKTLLPVLACITVGVAAGAFWAWLHFGELSQVRVTHSGLEDQNNQQKPQLAYLASLKGEQAEYADRANTIKEIASSHVTWTRKLDEFWDVVNESHRGERFLIWLTEMEVKRPDARGVAQAGKGAKKPVEGERITLGGLSFSNVNNEGDPLQRLNQFRDAILGSEFFKTDFLEISNPAGKAVQMDDGLDPSKAWTLDLAMTMKARQAATRPSGVEAQAPKKSK